MHTIRECYVPMLTSLRKLDGQQEPTTCHCLPADYLLFYLFKIHFNPYPTAFPYGNGMVLHFYQQQESSTTKTVHKVINKGLKTYV